MKPIAKEKYLRALPSLFTLANIFCGFSAVTLAIHACYIASSPSASANLFKQAGILILIASLLDVIDGLAARSIKNPLKFGKELDSLADAMSFGFSSAVLMLLFSLHHLDAHETLPKTFWILYSIYPLCTCIRLAQFNVETDQKSPGFYGLPSPAAALTLIAILLTFIQNPSELPPHRIIAPAMLILSILMISKIPYPRPGPSSIIFVILLAFLLSLVPLGMLAIPLGYILFGLIRGYVMRIIRSH